MTGDETTKKVKAKWIVSIPAEAKIKVKAGDEVEADEELLRVEETKEVSIDFSREAQILNPKDKDRFLVENVGKILARGEIIFEKKGLFVKKILSPGNGKLLKLDEFNNLHYRLEGIVEKVVRSPVKAKVVETSKDDLVLEFRAEEFSGTGLTEGKSWGLKGLGTANKISDVNFEDEGTILLVKEPDRALVSKAEVVGVKGIVVLSKGEGNNDRIDSKLPIVALSEKLFERLKGELGKETRVLLNANNGRIWLTI